MGRSLDPEAAAARLRWGSQATRPAAPGDLVAGLTVGAMLVPQAMAYALLAGLPPEVGLYASTVPVVVYALIGTSRQLSVGPVAIVSLMTASALAGVADQGPAATVEAAALLAILVGAVHLVLGAGRLGFLVNFLSHSVLVGFTAAAALIIGSSQVKHVLGVSVPRTERFHETVGELVRAIDRTHWPTLAVGSISLAVLVGLKRLAPRAPAALVVVAGSIVAVRLLGLRADGVAVVGDIPRSLPPLGIPSVRGGMFGDLAPAAIAITLVGFTQSIAVAKVYARRHRYDVDPNRELIGIGAANVAAGLFGGCPITGGLSRTAVADSAGARTSRAAMVAAAVVVLTLVLLTPLFAALPNAALGAIIVMAVAGLIDVGEIRHIARVKRSDMIGLTVAFVATLVLGLELGIVVAVVASMLVVFGRMSMPHSATLGHVAGTTSYRNLSRFPDAGTVDGVRIVRVDASVSFVNASHVKRILQRHADDLDGPPMALVLDASGINDVDATGADMLAELVAELRTRGVQLHLSDVKGPVRDVLRRAGLRSQLGACIHTSTHDAVLAIAEGRGAPSDLQRAGIDERPALPGAAATSVDGGQHVRAADVRAYDRAHGGSTRCGHRFPFTRQ